MARLFYAGFVSLDGYINDPSGSFDWAMPDEEVHAVANDLERGVGMHLYGRRMYEVMSFWQDPAHTDGAPDVMKEYGEIWRASDKTVYSTTLHSVATPRTDLQRAFDSDAVRALKRSSELDISIGGPTLAAHAFAARLIDDIHLFIAPVIVGGGTRALPDGLRQDLEVVSERRFANGMVHLHYRLAP